MHDSISYMYTDFLRTPEFNIVPIVIFEKHIFFTFAFGKFIVL